MAISAADVKRLREETDAPMMECKAALEEAGGDYEKAKQVLREKGKAAAAKRSDRTTAEGVVAVVMEGNKLGAIILECETDFVAKNEDFIALASDMAKVVLQNAAPGQEAATIADSSGKTLAQYCEDAVAKIRENIQVRRALKLEGGTYAYYVHHDRKAAAVVEIDTAGEKQESAARDAAIQIVALKPEYVNKSDIPADRLQKELDIEYKRAIEEGKPEDRAKMIAEGRVNKETVKAIVLLEQDFFKDASMNVGKYLQDQGAGVKILAFHHLKVGS